jgi:choline dehydrogenase-like flavoprotein
MATSEQHGVVDANCAVFGVPNLFMAGGSVFSTAGHANPTLTIVALAVRLAGHLKAKLA